MSKETHPALRAIDITKPGADEKVREAGKRARELDKMTPEQLRQVDIREWDELDEMLYQLGVYG